ncbi:nitroreductase [Thalassoporum mexicanum PCC 7367]|uniref:nitroreductase family protein n=1 Tax=Thalassoporum mexicanum TaxID=3457544 RepID=UPI00029FB786|nr:nitroreductase family protein [Pseudanabaena sp. PCC 7367]AFY70671.1 nitroreductase [Pseudanabaena sp. PCC 7367]
MNLAEKTNLATNPLAVPEAILKRRSTRSFNSEPIAPELLNQLLDLTIAAPSSWNLQSWHLIMVQDEAQKAALAEAAWGQKQIIQAPVTFVFVGASYIWQDQERWQEICRLGIENNAWNDEFVGFLNSSMPPFQEALGEKNREYAIKDAMIAATHLALAAESLGLASCFMNGWLEDQVKQVIGIADRDDLAIALLLPIGYTDEQKSSPGRLPKSRRVFVGSLDSPYNG